MVRSKMKHKELMRRMKEDEVVQGIMTFEDWWEHHVSPHLGRIIAGVLVIAVIAGGVWLFKRQLQVRQDDALQQYMSANRAFNENDYDSTATTIKSLLETYPNTRGAMLGRLLEAELKYAEGSYNEALSIYEEVLPQIPPDLKNRVLLSMAYTQESLKRFDKAVQLYQQLLKQADTDETKGYFNFCLGRVAEAQDKDEQALEFYRAVPEETYWYNAVRGRINRLSAPIVRLGDAIKQTG